MKRYKLLKNLPTFNAGDKFYINDCGDLVLGTKHNSDPQTEWGIVAYCRQTLEKFPNILDEWFEKISEEPKTMYDLERGDRYYIVLPNGDIESDLWTNSLFDIERRDMGSICLTEEEAIKVRDYCKARAILKRDAKGFKPKWGKEWSWGVIFNDAGGTLNACMQQDNDGTIRFETEADTKESIHKHEKEWKTYLGVEEC